MRRIHDRYLLKQFTRIFVFSVLAFCVIYVIVNVFEEMNPHVGMLRHQHIILARKRIVGHHENVEGQLAKAANGALQCESSSQVIGRNDRADATSCHQFVITFS